MPRDYGLLAEQPLSVANAITEELGKIVISAITGNDGSSVVISRYADHEWNLWPFISTANTAESGKTIKWMCTPEIFRDVCKSVTYRYWVVGRPGRKSPSATTLIRFVKEANIFLRYLDGCGISSLDDIHQIHISNYIHAQKLKGLTPGTLELRLSAIETLHIFADQHKDGMKLHPWPSSSASEIAGNRKFKSTFVGKTPLIPLDVAQTLFAFAEEVLKGADALLDQRDAGERPLYRDSEATLIRNACFFLLGLLTGMRCDEIVGIEVGAGRTEVKDGITYHWITSIEHKTLKGKVEYLMPSMGHQILRILERWSEPLRQELRMQLMELEAEKSHIGQEERLKRIAMAKTNINRLFIGRWNGKVIGSISGHWATRIMAEFANLAGTDWELAPHQLRRMYAWTFVRHRLGNMLFLKEQFKHNSLSMTQLYCANSFQDIGLYDEIFDETRQQKVQIIQGWMDEPLAGGAGKRLMELRAHDFPNRVAMIEETADKINIRSTGHGWCLTQDDGCGGSGLYERIRCGACGNGLIDSNFAPVWTEIYNHQKELLEDVQDLGQGAIDRVKRDLAKAKTVLTDLGVHIQGEPDGKSARS